MWTVEDSLLNTGTLHSTGTMAVVQFAAGVLLATAAAHPLLVIGLAALLVSELLPFFFGCWVALEPQSNTCPQACLLEGASDDRLAFLVPTHLTPLMTPPGNAPPHTRLHRLCSFPGESTGGSTGTSQVCFNMCSCGLWESCEWLRWPPHPPIQPAPPHMQAAEEAAQPHTCCLCFLPATH